MTAGDVHDLQLELPMSLMLNLNQRSNWRGRARGTADVRAIAHGRALMPPRVGLPAADLTVGIGWPDRRRRDAHNYVPVLKAAIDGFVDAGVLPYDHDDYLTGPDIRTWLAGVPKTAVLIFRFTERDPEPIERRLF